MTLRTYVEMLQFQDRLHSHAYFRKATTAASELESCGLDSQHLNRPDRMQDNSALYDVFTLNADVSQASTSSSQFNSYLLFKKHQSKTFYAGKAKVPVADVNVPVIGGHAYRMFSDISGTWNGVLEDVSDVKELVPELFYQPEVLTNENSIDFGTTQLGGKLAHFCHSRYCKTSCLG
ncbi:hypothetical protein KIW84_022419 [Lathyrus oleraceus]|uniref:BEACH domain-containing protein n=1 Tax=Pisum sativum TaxID=3888 RepID=A0A9D5BAR1_PEA|nr:hypothetical protein KIW84_022419 [Pisum sativum]